MFQAEYKLSMYDRLLLMGNLYMYFYSGISIIFHMAILYTYILIEHIQTISQISQCRVVASTQHNHRHVPRIKRKTRARVWQNIYSAIKWIFSIR